MLVASADSLAAIAAEDAACAANKRLFRWQADDTGEMNREGAETYLRRLAEAELRRATTAPGDGGLPLTSSESRPSAGPAARS